MYTVFRENTPLLCSILQTLEVVEQRHIKRLTFDIVYFFLSFTLYLLLCCTVLNLVLYYLAIQPLAARVFLKLNQYNDNH